MRKRRQERVFGAIGGPGRSGGGGADLGPLDRERDPITGESEQLYLLLLKLPRAHAPHMQHANQAPINLERYARQRVEALLANVAAHNLIVVHVLYDNGTPLGRNAAREALANWDAHLVLLLLLQSDRGTHAKLLLPPLLRQLPQ